MHYNFFYNYYFKLNTIIKNVKIKKEKEEKIISKWRKECEINNVLFVPQANPPQFDRAEDLSQLRFLNESSVLHTLRQRYASNLIHTYAGESMIVINPIAPLAIYSEKVITTSYVQKFQTINPKNSTIQLHSMSFTTFDYKYIYIKFF